MTGLLMARFAPSTGKSERDSSRALNFVRSSFASFLAPSRKEESEESCCFYQCILDKPDENSNNAF